MKIHNPKAVWPVPAQFERIYSHGVEVDLGGHRELHIAGQIGVDPDGYISESFTGQCLQALSNVETILASAEMATEDVVRVTYYVTRRDDLPALNEVRQSRWDGVRPAVTTLVVAGLAKPELLVEVEVLAKQVNPTSN